jgi:hypothetical protein
VSETDLPLYTNRGRILRVLIRPSGRGGKGAPRNCLCQDVRTGEKFVRPFRGLRRVKEKDNVVKLWQKKSNTCR